MPPVVCAACGSKVKGGRSQCPRCGELLVFAETSDPSKAFPKAPAMLAGSVLSLAVLIAVAVWVQSQAPASSTAAMADQAQPLVQTPGAKRAGVEAPSTSGERPFMDSSRAGTAAYVQGDFAQALRDYQLAVEKNPQDFDSLNNLGQVLVRSGRAAEAVPYFERALVLNSSSWAVRFNLAHAYGQQGDWARAVTEYRTAALQFPDDYVTRFNLGLALHKLGQEEAALTEYKSAIELAPSEPSFRLSLGLTYERLNRAADAARAYREYLELAPSAPDAAAVKSRVEALTQPSAAPAGQPMPSTQAASPDKRS